MNEQTWLLTNDSNQLPNTKPLYHNRLVKHPIPFPSEFPFPLRHYTRMIAYLSGYPTYSQNYPKRETQLDVRKADGSRSIFYLIFYKI